jgi:hypothetical protein
VIDRSGRGGAVCLRRGVDKLRTERSLGTAQVHVPTRPWRPRRRREHDPSSPHVHSRRDSMRSPETRRPESPVKDVDHAFPVSRPPGAAASSDQAPLLSKLYGVLPASVQRPNPDRPGSRRSSQVEEAHCAPRRATSHPAGPVRGRAAGCAVDGRGAQSTAGVRSRPQECEVHRRLRSHRCGPGPERTRVDERPAQLRAGADTAPTSQTFSCPRRRSTLCEVATSSAKWTGNALSPDRDDGQGLCRESAPEGIRTPNLLIRSQMLYPLSYGRISSVVAQPCWATPARRLRDLNPGWGVTPNRISSAAP